MDWKIFLTTFALIFAAELPDKTMFAVLLMSARHSAAAVFVGAAAAFLVQNIIAVLFGSLFSLLPPRLIHGVSGILFLGFAARMWLKKEEADPSNPEVEPRGRSRFWKTAASAFVVIFIAEWGDITQLSAAALIARYRAPATIFTAATLALWSVTALGVCVGRKVGAHLHPERLQKVAAALFALVGIFLLLRA